MLYNPVWEKPSIDGLRGWLSRHDPGTTYNYYDCSGDCLICRYLGALGYTDLMAEYGQFETSAFRQHIANGRQMSGADRWTYGAALARLDAYLDIDVCVDA